MKYVIDVSMEDADESFTLASVPLLPLPGDTVQVMTDEGPVVGVVKDRHFAYESPGTCRVALACKRL